MRRTMTAACAGATLIGIGGIACFLFMAWLWCSAAAFSDANMRLEGEPKPRTPPPGPVYLETDSYYWLSYAQRIARGEDWRIRYTQVDNYPDGREVHWSQIISWSMVLSGKVRQVFTHEDLKTAVEQGSLAINPLLFALAAGALFVSLSQRFGVLPSGLFIAFLSTLPDTTWIFQALRPDHQGYHVAFGGVSVVAPLLGGMGLVSRRSEQASRWRLFREAEPTPGSTAWRWFVLGGVATGLGLWVSALVESFFIYPLLGIFVFLVASITPERLEENGLLARPRLWRIWGWTAGLTSLFFYFVEYFPHHMAVRLEVNHPVYSLAAVAAGEAMALLAQWRWAWAGRASPGRIAMVGVAFLIAALPVLLIMAGPTSWHHMRDPQMWRMAQGVQEFLPFTQIVKKDRLWVFFQSFGVLPVLSALTLVCLRRRELKVVQMTWLWHTFAFASFFMAAGLWQSRWIGFGAGALCLSAMVSGHFIWAQWAGRSLQNRPWGAVAIALVLLVQPLWFFWRPVSALRHDLTGKSIEQSLLAPVLLKRMACALKNSPNRPKAIMAVPDFAPTLIYFAQIPVVASLYWENFEGLSKATRFFAASNSDDAREVARQTGVTHVMILPSASMAYYFSFIATGKFDAAQTRGTLLARLHLGAGPSWIQPDFDLNFITHRRFLYFGQPITDYADTFRIER